MLNFELENKSELEALLNKEWLLSNGMGSYASSTIVNCNTRKYHGLLVVKLDKPAGKFVLVSNLEENLVVGNQTYFLNTNQYQKDLFQPKAYENLQSFRLDPYPCFFYKIADFILKKEILMVEGENTTLIRYSLNNKQKKIKLKIRPMLSFRDFHSLSKQNIFLQVRTFPSLDGFFLTPYQGLPNIYFNLNLDFQNYPSPDWYYNIYLAEEEKRGFDFQEDLFTPSIIELDLKDDLIMSMGLKNYNRQELTELWQEQSSLQKEKFKQDQSSELENILGFQSLNFITKLKKDLVAITAGYHWFLEWGRDAFIALTGIALFAKKEPKLILAVSKTYLEFLKNGIVPNFLSPDLQNNAYNSADASLWLIYALQNYIETTADYQSVFKLMPKIKEIFNFYSKGTDYDIKMAENGLLSAGNQNTQITWMDATCNGKPVTPRSGFTVELNALWYNFVCFLNELAIKSEDHKLVKQTQEIIDKIDQNFIPFFWLPEGYLADFFDIEKKELNKQLRPNQIFAVSLKYSPISKDKAKKIVETVEKELFTPFGLRTLSKSDKMYKGQYFGNSEARDSAYHNGTVWTWLICHFFEALDKVTENKSELLSKIDLSLSCFNNHIKENGLGFISEIFDGNDPFLARGCIAQAWSCAEVLRLINLKTKIKKG